MKGFDSQKRQMVLAVTIAVIAALGLAVSVSYGFSSTGTTTTSTTISNNCTLTNPPMLSLPPNSTLKENGTISIGGTTYWYVTFIKGNLTTVNFHGVQFSFNAGFVQPPFAGSEVQVNNATRLSTSGNSNSLGGCGSFLPQVTLTFHDGSSVVYNKEIVTITAIGANVTYAKPISNPWFTQHTSPQAGVGYQTNGGEMTLYVSTS